MLAVETYGVTKLHRGKAVVNDFSFALEAGETCAIKGNTSSGKSTLLMMLAGLLSPSSGSIQLFGTNIAGSYPQMNKYVGFVPQRVCLPMHMSVEGILQYSAWLHKINKDAVRTKMFHLMDLLDLYPQDRVTHLNEESRKKLSLAAAVIHAPDLILVDDITMVFSQKELIQVITLLSEEQKRGAAVLAASRGTDGIAKFCHKTVPIHKIGVGEHS